MAPSHGWKWPLPHELAFCASWLAAAVALWARGAWLTAMFFALCMALGVLLIFHCQYEPTPLRWRIRLAYYPLVVVPLYTQLPAVVQVLNPSLQDSRLQAVDRWLVGGDISLGLEPIVSPAVTELFSTAYLLYVPYLGASVLPHLADKPGLAIRFCMGVSCVFAFGFLGYTLVPAHGPYLALAHRYSVPLTGGILTRLNAAIVQVACNRIDVFPSLHCAAPAFILAFEFLHKRRRFWIALVPCVLLWTATVYLRYHYAIDLAAGFVLALAALVLSHCWPSARVCDAAAKSAKIHPPR